MKFFAQIKRVTPALVLVGLASCSEKSYPNVVTGYANVSAPVIPREVIPSPISDAAVESHIDTTMPAADRDVIKNIMLHIPQIARANVIYFSQNGKVYANHAALKREVELLRPAQGLVSTYVGRDGKLLAGPPALPKPREIADGLTHRMYMNPPPVTTTGPYRRLYSDGAFHYTYASASIAPRSCPLTPTATQGAAGDTGYIYSGGWSGSGRDTADGGFQYSAAHDVFNLFIKVASATGQPTPIDNVNWPCRGHTRFISLSPAAIF